MGSKRCLMRSPNRNKGSNGSLNALDRRSLSPKGGSKNALDKASTHTTATSKSSTSKKAPLRRLSSKVIESMADQGLDELQIAMMKFDRKEDKEERVAKERRRTKLLKQASRGRNQLMQKSASTRSLLKGKSNSKARPGMGRRRSSSTNDLLNKAKKVQGSLERRKKSIVRRGSFGQALLDDSDDDSDAPIKRDSARSKNSLGSNMSLHTAKSLPLTYMKDWSDSDESDGDSDSDDSSFASVTSSLSGSGGTISTSDKSKNKPLQTQTVVCQINGSFTNVQILSPTQQLTKVLGEPTWLDKPSFDWEDYFSDTSSYREITPQVQAAVKSKEAHRLQKLWERGESMNACNPQTGESLVQMVCQRGCRPQLEFLMKEAKVDVRVRDGAGKTVLHEVAWNPTFDPELVMLLLLHSPELLYAPDSRGFLPLDYVPKRTLIDWYAFLETKQKQLKLALEFSQWKATSQKLNATQERLNAILQRHYHKGIL